MKLIDLTGKIYCRLIVIGKSDNKISGETIWECLCECGNLVKSNGYNLKNGNTKSCGCLRKELTISRSLKHGMAQRGLHLSEYDSYNSMVQRCYNEKLSCYKNYGGRGITVCDRWLGEDGFENFLKDMGRKPSPEFTIDRFPNNETGIYEPSNCRWATPLQQGNNKRNNHWIEYKDEIKTLSQWAIFFKAGSGNVCRMLKKKTFDEVYKYYFKNTLSDSVSSV